MVVRIHLDVPITEVPSREWYTVSKTARAARPGEFDSPSLRTQRGARVVIGAAC